jgi:hypothetical protein
MKVAPAPDQCNEMDALTSASGPRAGWMPLPVLAAAAGLALYLKVK